MMIGTALNMAGIIIGSWAGLVRVKSFAPATEAFWKVMLGAFTVYYGLRLTWVSLNGSAGQILKQLLIVIIAMSLGKAAGWALRFQKLSNHLGQKARTRMQAAASTTPQRMSEGFEVCAALFCAAPLGLVGAIEDGVSDYFYPLAVKGVMDGLGSVGLARVFGWGVMLSALPVLAFQGSVTLVCATWVRPFLSEHNLVDSVSATGGLLVFSVALVMLQIKRVTLADYLPSLIFAPVITWIWR